MLQKRIFLFCESSLFLSAVLKRDVSTWDAFKSGPQRRLLVYGDLKTYI